MATKPTRLLELRKRYGWTQRDLAEHLEVDPVTVSRWERGVSSPRQRIARQIDRLLAAAAPARKNKQNAASTPPAPAPSRFEGIDELVRIVGLDRALEALRTLALVGRVPAPVRFAADPTTRLREVEAALRQQSELIARARISRK